MHTLRSDLCTQTSLLVGRFSHEVAMEGATFLRAKLFTLNMRFYVALVAFMVLIFSSPTRFAHERLLQLSPLMMFLCLV